jgi:hypothetical protein
LVSVSEVLEIERSLPHGHVAAALGTLRHIGLESDVARSSSPQRDLICALIVARILAPASQPATARGLREQTASSSLGTLLGLELVDEDHLYEAMDWLLSRQARIEDKLAGRHLQEGSVVLYDVTSTYFEGRHFRLARYGHSRDERPGNLPIVFGLLTNHEGCPVAVEVFEGNTGDPKTVAAQICKLRQPFRLKEVVFDQPDLAEIQHPAYPGRLIACRNPLLAKEQKRKREELLSATEKRLEKIRAATQRKRRPLRGKKEIGLAVGKVLGHYKNGEAFAIDHRRGDRFDWKRKPASIEQEAALDGIYVIRTSVRRATESQTDLSSPGRTGEDSCVVVHAGVLRGVAYAPGAGAAVIRRRGPRSRASAAHQHGGSGTALRLGARQSATQQTAYGLPVHSFRTLLADLATLTRNRVRVGEQAFDTERKARVETGRQPAEALAQKSIEKELQSLQGESLAWPR